MERDETLVAQALATSSSNCQSPYMDTRGGERTSSVVVCFKKSKACAYGKDISVGFENHRD